MLQPNSHSTAFSQNVSTLLFATILYFAGLTSSASPVHPPEQVSQSCQRKGGQQRSHYCTCDAAHRVTSRLLGQHPSHHEQENDLDPHTTISQRRHDTQKKRYYVCTPPQLPPMLITARSSRMWTSTVTWRTMTTYVHITLTSSAFGSCGTVRLCYKVLSTRNRQSIWTTTFWSYFNKREILKWNSTGHFCYLLNDPFHTSVTFLPH